MARTTNPRGSHRPMSSLPRSLGQARCTRQRGQRFRCILGLSKNGPQDSNFHVEKGDQASSVGVRMLPLPPVSASQLVILDVWLTW
jgi:hypothetical protein